MSSSEAQEGGYCAGIATDAVIGDAVQMVWRKLMQTGTQYCDGGVDAENECGLQAVNVDMQVQRFKQRSSFFSR
jgi:hypothetical protein